MEDTVRKLIWPAFASQSIIEATNPGFVNERSGVRTSPHQHFPKKTLQAMMAVVVTPVRQKSRKIP